MPLPESPPLGRLPFEPPEAALGFPDLALFWELWRQEKFWACHEALEDVWRRESNASRKRFLRGLIHGAVAVFHFRRGNFAGAVRQLARARARLQATVSPGEDASRGIREGVDAARFLEGIGAEVAPALEALTESERAGLAALEARLLSESAQ